MTAKEQGLPELMSDLLSVLEAGQEASLPLTWIGLTEQTPEQAKEFLTKAVDCTVEDGVFTGEVHGISEAETDRVVAITGCGPKGATNAKHLIWCAHFVHKHKAALAALASDTGERGVVETKALDEVMRRFESTIPTPSNHRGESTMRIEHFVDLVHEAKKELAALRAQPAGGGEWPLMDGAKTPNEFFNPAPPESGGQGESVTVRRNDDGSLDEVVGSGEFHLEQMDGGHWYLALGPHMLSLHSKKVIKAEIELNAFAQGGGNER